MVMGKTLKLMDQYSPVNILTINELDTGNTRLMLEIYIKAIGKTIVLMVKEIMSYVTAKNTLEILLTPTEKDRDTWYGAVELNIEVIGTMIL